MSHVLGIDTGGTFTDGIILNLETKEILAAVKSPTTHKDLIIGISNTIEHLPYDLLKTVDYLSLSTTLATNAIVENRGCRVGLLLLGAEPSADLPQCEYQILPGTMNIRGEETVPLDLEETRKAIESFRGKVDAVAVSGIFSIRNDNHEKTVKQIVRETLHCPVVAAHELSSVIGMQERTVTAVLNARLLYVIDELLNATRTVLDRKKLDIPIMVVKGDGSLMNESIARERPIETILSGPAASIIGATFLSNIQDGIVLDMGGTTTDIAILHRGVPRLDPNGAKVGGWHTRVSAVEATTFGLGGDSRIHFDEQERQWKLGPRRSWPVSVICKKYPNYFEELQQISLAPPGLTKYELVDGYFLLHQPSTYTQLSELQEKALEIVKDAPHTLVEISRQLQINPNFLSLDSLVDHGILGTVGFTPTDILQLKGHYHAGKEEAAMLALDLLAKNHGYKTSVLIDIIEETMTKQMCRVILDSMWTYEKEDLDPFSGDHAIEYFIENALGKRHSSLISNSISLNEPIIGIGAPTKSWLPPAGERLHTETIFPSHNHVANAVGAAAGKVMTIFRILVQNHDTAGIEIYAPWGKSHFKPSEHKNEQEQVPMEIAVQKAIQEGKTKMEEEMARQGINQYEILVEQKDSKIDGPNSGFRLHIETNIEIAAVGLPQNRVNQPQQKSLLGKFWGKDKNPDFSKLPTV